MDRNIRVMVVDDHEVVRCGIAEIVDRAEGLEVIAEADGYINAVRRAELVRPDVMLIDLQLIDGTGIDVVRALNQSLPDTKCIILTSFDDDSALSQAVEVGAKAFILKNVHGAEIVDVIRAVAAGRVLLDKNTLIRRLRDNDDPTRNLTPSERKVLDLIAKGMSNREIADKLGVAEKTVKNHITSLLAKMGLRRRTQVIAWMASQKNSSWQTSVEK